MRRRFKRTFALAAAFAMALSAGALVLEVGGADGSSEAKALNAVMVARVTACHEPGKSTVTASLVQFSNGELRRTPLKVVPLKTAGSFAVEGPVPQGGVIDLAVSNPEYRNYQPRVLIRSGSHGLEWAGLKRFYSTPPVDSDIKTFLGTAD